MLRALLRPSTALLVVLVLAAPMRPLSAQSGNGAAGAVIGLVGGGIASMAVIVGSARAGHFLYSPTEARWQLLPTVAGAVGGGVLGYRNPDRLWRSAGYAAVGLAGGALLGAAVGRLLWDSGEDPWAGALLGAGAGVVAGALVGALSWEEGGAGPASVSVRLAVP